jgi:hypothetical protein
MYYLTASRCIVSIYEVVPCYTLYTTVCVYFGCVQRPQYAKQDKDDLIDVLPILLADLRLCKYMLQYR